MPTCVGNAWDLKITGRQDDAPMLFTNSGSSGTGQGIRETIPFPLVKRLG